MEISRKQSILLNLPTAVWSFSNSVVQTQLSPARLIAGVNYISFCDQMPSSAPAQASVTLTFQPLPRNLDGRALNPDSSKGSKELFDE